MQPKRAIIASIVICGVGAVLAIAAALTLAVPALASVSWNL